MASHSPLKSLIADYDLWVLPPFAHSQWFARVDWYLNWQMSKGLAFQRLKPSVELARVLEESGMRFDAGPESQAMPLLVSSQGRVASERCLVVDHAGDRKAWISAVHDQVQKLKSRRARVFLPKGMGVDEAQTLWKKLAPLEMQLEFSTDEENFV